MHHRRPAAGPAGVPPGVRKPYRNRLLLQHVTRLSGRQQPCSGQPLLRAWPGRTGVRRVAFGTAGRSATNRRLKALSAGTGTSAS